MGRQKGFIQTEENKVRISSTLTGRKLSPETKEKMRLAKLGKPRSEETKGKISIGMMGHQYYGNIKIVIDTATGIEYSTLKEAALLNNIPVTTLRHWLTGRSPNKSTLIYK